MPSFRRGQSLTRTTIVFSRRLARTYLPLVHEMSTPSSTLPRRGRRLMSRTWPQSGLFSPSGVCALQSQHAHGKDHRDRTLLEVVPDIGLAEDIFKHLDCRCPLGLLDSYTEGHLLDFGAQGWSHFDTPGGLAIRDADGNVISLRGEHILGTKGDPRVPCVLVGKACLQLHVA